jgi:hypothetical protein
VAPHKNSILEEFFFCSLEGSIREQGLLLSEEIKHYLLRLLLSRRQELPYAGMTTLTELYLSAKEEEYRFRKIDCFKKMGDISITKVGIFPGSFSRAIKSEYYRNMGILGYKETYLCSDNYLYYDLSMNYDLCVDAIHGINILSMKNDVLKLYDFWRKTKSRAAEKRLWKLGFSTERGVCYEE